MLIAALAAGALLAGSSSLLAQDNSTNTPSAANARRGMRGPNLDRLATTLKLTDDQKAKVKTVLDAQTQKMTDLRADTTLSQADRRTKMQAIRDDTTTQMKAILTDDQFAQYQKMTQRGGRRGGAGGGNPPPAPATPPAGN